MWIFLLSMSLLSYTAYSGRQATKNTIFSSLIIWLITKVGNWAKIKGVHTNIESICKTLRLTAKQCDQDSIAVSSVTIDEDIPTTNLNQLEPSFMYTQIFKEILLEIEHFIQFWWHQYTNNTFTLKIISEFERTSKMDIVT